MSGIKKISIVGGGLAGSEAAWFLGRVADPTKYRVVLYEQRPVKRTPVHRTANLAELVCSNSLKAESLYTPSGILKIEMSSLGSVVLKAAQEARVPGGKSLVVDRDAFSEKVSQLISSLASVEIIREEIKEIPDPPVIIATGPLTGGRFAESLRELLGEDFLYYYDAVAPIVDAESIDYSRTFWGSRYSDAKDYLNCPMTYDEYRAFVEALLQAEKIPLEAPDKELQFFESCLPVEEMARRGFDTLAYGPMRPVGLKVPEGTYAVVQLRREDLPGKAFSLVGFQTRLKWREQERVFRMIPCLREAEFLRYGVVHRNTYVLGPKVLERDLKIKTTSDLIFLSGQITGVEGYMESAMTGMVAARSLWRRLEGMEPLSLPPLTMSGALLDYVSSSDPLKFVPMNANFGLLPQVTPRELEGCSVEELSGFVIKVAKRYGVPLERLAFGEFFEEAGKVLSLLKKKKRFSKRERRILKSIRALKKLKSFLETTLDSQNPRFLF